MHGHNYGLVVGLIGVRNNDGWLMDFWDLDAIMQPIINRVDHQCLNEVPGLSNPTAEIIAHWFFVRIEQALENDDDYGVSVAYVTIEETKDCTATARNMELSR
jgi:6-pyruvoyltetrahydropterin/6-carboxytetrahydropterin synthase